MKCLNRNVLIGLGVVAVAVFFLAPPGRGALPLLLVAACPLSMILMMRGMSKMGPSSSPAAPAPTEPQREIERKDAEIARLEAMLRDGNRTDRL